MRPESELAWRLADYQQAGIEAPDRLLKAPEACEGELMTADEVAAFIGDSIGTLLVLLDSGSPKFERVRQVFLDDLDCLLRLGKIDADEYNEITSSEEMHL